MRNSDPITYKGVKHSSAFIDIEGTIGYVRIASLSLQDALIEDGLFDDETPKDVEAVDNQVAYYVSDEEFLLPVSQVKKIVRTAYDETSSFPTGQKTIRELKRGDFFRLRNSDTSSVWVRGDYDPALRKYSTHKFDDINHERFMKGKTFVFVGFTF